MTDAQLHTVATAPERSKPLLEAAHKAAGRVPNLHALMAESPALLEGYQTLHRLAVEATGFTATERTVVWQTVNVAHGCHYCVPAHTAIARAEGIDDAVTEALRDEEPLNEPRLDALRCFTLAVLHKRGQLSPGDMQAFLDAGYDNRAVMDVVAIVAQKLMSNYVNAIFGTPLDDALREFARGSGRRAA
ncbi:carboxymuconolactone decarboxylase family protein [Rhodobacteraceae bacterium 2CG4]|uniref:Carboxymuconolactone decarboxylase family protein n=1 Tax=Halovulum marinum TaxID=2662447 RepID=A0A6L5Z0L2_9RHOB|nr:carboxymuconolactone decarboxylase family protein [Halovulum marinum]MSU89630.1 carboxymuconolactone decarboxylase family protein [Halovulum marinum]